MKQNKSLNHRLIWALGGTFIMGLATSEIVHSADSQLANLWVAIAILTGCLAGANSGVVSAKVKFYQNELNRLKQEKDQLKNQSGVQSKQR